MFRNIGFMSELFKEKMFEDVKYKEDNAMDKCIKMWLNKKAQNEDSLNTRCILLKQTGKIFIMSTGR